MFSSNTYTTFLKNKYQQLVQMGKETLGFIKTNKNWSLQVLAYAASVLYIVVDTYNELVAEGESKEYALARGSGAALKLMLVPSILLPISRVLTTTLANTPLVNQLLCSDHRISTHKIIAGAIGIFSTTHAIAHYYNDSSKYREQSGMTGIIMLSSLVIPITGMYFLRHYTHLNRLSYGMQVIRPHQFGAAIFMSAYAFHTPDLRLMPFIFIFGGAYLIDVTIEMNNYTYASKITYAKILNDEMLSLRISNPSINWTSYQPGQYALISIKTDSFLEYPHPFTVVNADHDEIEFLIKNSGAWTKRLFKFVSKHGNDDRSTPTKIIVGGPFGIALQSIHRNKPFLFIATGVGMTPLLSYLHDLIRRDQNGPGIDICVIQRKFMQFEPCISALEKAGNTNVEINSVNFYVTGNEKRSDLKDQLKIAGKHNLTFFIAPKNNSDQAQPKINNEEILNNRLTLTGFVPRKIKVIVRQGRPDFQKIIAVSPKPVTVCGNPTVTEHVKRLAMGHSIKYYRENF